MTAAFNWSPGGCCCEPNAKGLFDIYGLFATPSILSQMPHPLGLCRYCTVFPDPLQTSVSTDLSYTGFRSKERVDWFIEPDIPPTNLPTFQSEGTQIGSPQIGSDYVWSIEVRDGIRYAVLYHANAISELERIAIQLPSSLTVNLTTYRPSDTTTIVMSSAGSDGFGFYSSASNPALLHIINTDGTQQKVTGNSTFVDEELPGQDISVLTHFAPRDWPVAAGRRVYIATDGTGKQKIDFFFGESELSGTTLRVPQSNRTVAFTVTLQQASYLSTSQRDYQGQWIHFDELDGRYVGVLAWEDIDTLGRSLLNVVKIVNGTVVWQRQRVLGGNIPGQLMNWVNTSIPAFNGMVHAGFNGREYSCEFTFTTPPSTATPAGVLANPAKPCNIVIYSGGGESWRSNAVVGSGCLKSSDHWFYISNPPSSGTFANELRTFVPNVVGGSPDGWLVSADGLQAIPAGEFVYDTTTVKPHASVAYGNKYDCVHNTTGIVGTLPSDGALFEDALKASAQ